MENRSLSFTGADAGGGIAGGEEEGVGTVPRGGTVGEVKREDGEAQEENELEEGDEGEKKDEEQQEEEQEQQEEKVDVVEIDTPSNPIEIAAPEPSTPPPTDTPEPPLQPPLPPLQTPPRDLRKILEAANIANPSLLSADQIIPPSPVVKPGELHEFSADTTDPRARRRSSLNAGIAGLEELRNRTAAEGKDGMGLDVPIHGSLQDLVEATNLTGLDALMQYSAHVIDAFVRLDFDDGQVFYVRNSSVIFGRAEGASSSSFQQIGPDGSTVIGNEPFGGFDPKTTPGAMSMKREKKKRRKKKSGEKSMAASAASSGSRRGSMVQRRDFPLFRETYERQQACGDDAIPVIHLPLNGSDAVPVPPRKNISRRHALLAYNFGKHRFEFKVTGKNGAFVDEEFVENGSTWIVPDKGMRIQIGGIGFKIVIPTVGQFGTGGFEEKSGAPPGRGKGKMSLAFTDEHGNEVRTDYDSEDEEEEDMVRMDEEEDGEMDSDESMEGLDEVEEEGSGDEEENDDEVEDEEAEQGDAENDGESSSELSSSSDEEEEAPPPEPVKVEKKRGRGRPRKDESALSRIEADKARAKELARQKEDRKKKEKAEAARRAKEVDRERAAERKRLEKEERQKQKDKQAREREREKERERREREQRKEQQKKLHLPQSKEEQPKKPSKLYLPTPAAKKKDGEKSLTSAVVKKGPGRPPKTQQQQNELQKPEQSSPSTFNDSATAPVPVFAPVTESVSPQPPMQEPEQAFSPSNPLMAVAAFNATAPPIDPQLYSSTPNYNPPISMHPHATTHQHSSPPRGNKQKEQKPKKEKPQPKKRTPSPELNEADYPPEALLKPAASYVILIHEAITNSGEEALTLPQIYKAIERKYPYFKLRVTTTGWQSSVRHNLGAHKAFNKVTRSGKGWLWGINPGVSIEKEKNKASIAAQRPAAYQQQQQAGMPYPSSMNGHYQQPQVNGQYQQVPIYTPDNAQINGNHPQRPQYSQPVVAPQQSYTQPQPQHQQPSRIPPMPMAYQPPAQPATTHTNGHAPIPRPAATVAPAQQFPNAPIPSPSGKLVASPEVVAAIEVLKKQLAVLTSNSATRDASGMDPKLVGQAQSVIQGLVSGRLKNVGVEVVKQLSKLLDMRVTALKQGAKVPQQTQAPVAAPPPPPPPQPPQAMTPTPTPNSAPAPAATITPVSPVTPAKVDYKNLPIEKKQALYRALMLAKEKKEKEAREAAAAVGNPGGVKRSLENGGGEPVAKKVDVSGGGS